MKKLWLSILSFVLFLGACTPDKKENRDSYQITVALDSIDTANLILSYEKDGDYLRDTATATKGVFTFSGKAIEPSWAYLRLQDSDDVLRFFLENADIKINGKKDSLSQAYVSGSALNLEYNNLKSKLAPNDKKLKDLYNAYYEGENSQALSDSLERVIKQVEQLNNKINLDFIFTNRSSIVAAYQAEEMFFYNPDVSMFDSTFNVLDTALQNSSVGKKMRARLDVAKRTDINQPAPDFTLTDKNGKQQSLGNFRGKVVLIDFWASWCGPCRDENPNLVKAYNKFNQRGFEIVGVSIDVDKDKDKWLKAIQEDRLTWPQLLAPEGWKSETAKTYGVIAIPMNFLVNGEGKIIAKGLRGGDLESKLNEIIK